MSLSIEKPESISLSDYDIFTRAGAFFFDVQRAQQFEYHFAHMLDKPFEAAFGFIHVLPGAFSGYNMSELFGKGNSILKEYFRSINEEGNYKLNS
jgi:cellulose synthase/poly-beta-1,6-N-acetylglucosamine synthase-like glycosyltransferase